ncbi:MAG TPA: hypothetical protein VHG35_09610 [Gemmatimonadales bacterium]|nr:hypothetical protein [Gemmatimonadales bacterium]
MSDLADAHVRALDYLARGGVSAALNLGTGRGYSVREIVRAVERVGRGRIPTREMPRRPGDVPVLIAEATKASSVLGWRPRRSDLDTIVTTAWLWHSRRSRADRTTPPAPRENAATLVPNGVAVVG